MRSLQLQPRSHNRGLISVNVGAIVVTMHNCANRAFEALVGAGIQKWKSVGFSPALSASSLRHLLGQEPVDPSGQAPHGLDRLSEDYATWPYLEFVHASRILPHLSLCPRDTLGYLIHWLPEPLRSAASKQMDQPASKMPEASVAQQFIRRSWRPFLDALETAPAIFCPKDSDLEWLKLDEQQILWRCQAMSLYAITPCLKDYIDRVSRDQMKEALRALPGQESISFIRFVRSSRHELSAELPYHFPIHLWDGSVASMLTLCEKFGLACLGRLLSEKSQAFKEEFAQHLSVGTWSMIPQITTPIEPETLAHLKTSFELGQTFERTVSRHKISHHL